jgi:hypothetical protein
MCARARRDGPRKPRPVPPLTPGETPTTTELPSPEGIINPNLSSEPLRREAERHWAKSDRAAAGRARRRKRNASGTKQAAEIEQLKDKLKKSEQELSRRRRSKKEDGKGDRP